VWGGAPRAQRVESAFKGATKRIDGQGPRLDSRPEVQVAYWLLSDETMKVGPTLCGPSRTKADEINQMVGEAHRRGFGGFLVKRPGALVVGVWVVLFLASFGVAALVDWAEYQYTIVDRAAERAGSRLLRGVLPGSGAAWRALEHAASVYRWLIAGVISAGFAWLLAFSFVAYGTERWVTARDGWTRVQAWHGGKLLMLYLTFMAVAARFAAVSKVTMVVTSTLLLVACAAILVRATWNWFTGRETQRRLAGDG